MANSVKSDKTKLSPSTKLLGKKQYVYIISIHQKNDTTIIEADYIQYLTGQDAINAAIKTHESDTFKTADGKVHVDVPNDYFIVNENKKIRSLVLSKNCAFDLVMNPERNSTIIDNSFSSFIKAYKNSPFVLTLNDDNVVIGIEEVFIP